MILALIAIWLIVSVCVGSYQYIEQPDIDEATWIWWPIYLFKYLVRTLYRSIVTGWDFW